MLHVQDDLKPEPRLGERSFDISAVSNKSDFKVKSKVKLLSQVSHIIILDLVILGVF